MRIVALVKSADHVCCRYRLAAYQPFLEYQGHTLDLRPWPQTWLSRLWLHNSVGQADVLILQRKMPPAWQYPLLRRAASTLIYDFDDALFCRDSYAPQGVACASRMGRFQTTLENVDYVVTGNPFLQDKARQRVNGKKSHLIPTCVNVDRYPSARHAADNHSPQLVWIGTWSTLQGLDQVRPMFESVGRRFPKLVFKIICDRFLKFERLATVQVPWSEAIEADELAQADIGISWLPDDLWSQGKCGLKILQYMAAGLPVVANPVGMHSQLVRHGENGFLVENTDELLHALEVLAADPLLRRQMGQAGRELVAAQYSIRQGATSWLSLLEQIAREQAQPAGTLSQASAALLTD
jgi:glycosyltransferase involved in cell wall biosynthesis